MMLCRAMLIESQVVKKITLTIFKNIYLRKADELTENCLQQAQSSYEGT